MTDPTPPHRRSPMARWGSQQIAATQTQFIPDGATALFIIVGGLS